MNIKLFITDIDGVWTDGGMYYDTKDIEFKKFNTKDSVGVLFLRLLKIPVAIITSENSPIVDRRAKKLEIEYSLKGIKDKLSTANQLCQELNISIKNTAFIGDEINDLELLKNVGLSACPADAPNYIKNSVDWILENKGGDGVFREFVEKYLIKYNLMDHVLKKYNRKV